MHAPLLSRRRFNLRRGQLCFLLLVRLCFNFFPCNQLYSSLYINRASLNSYGCIVNDTRKIIKFQRVTTLLSFNGQLTPVISFVLLQTFHVFFPCWLSRFLHFQYIVTGMRRMWSPCKCVRRSLQGRKQAFFGLFYGSLTVQDMSVACHSPGNLAWSSFQWGWGLHLLPRQAERVSNFHLDRTISEADISRLSHRKMTSPKYCYRILLEHWIRTVEFPITPSHRA